MDKETMNTANDGDLADAGTASRKNDGVAAATGVASASAASSQEENGGGQAQELVASGSAETVQAVNGTGQQENEKTNDHPPAPSTTTTTTSSRAQPKSNLAFGMDISAIAAAAAKQASAAEEFGADDPDKTVKASTTSSKQQHKRHISWGKTITRITSMASAVSAVKQINPLEQEAETHIIASLEDLEARNRAAERSSSGGGDKHRKSDKKPEILEFLPREAEGVFDDLSSSKKAANSATGSHHADDAASVGPKSVGSTTTRRTRTTATAHRRVPTTTVAEDLFSLTNALEALHAAPLTTSSTTTSAAAPGPGQSLTTTMKVEKANQAAGSADLLAANAALLFRRRTPKKVVVDADGQVGGKTGWSEGGHAVGMIPMGAAAADTAADGGEEGTTAAPSPTAKSRWGKLQKTVAATQGMNLHKKTDNGDAAGPEQVPFLDGISLDIEGGGGDDSNGNDDKADAHNIRPSLKPTPVKKKPMMLAVLEGRSVVVRNFVKEQRQGNIVYLLIIVPLLAVAFILFYLAGNPPTGIIDFSRSNETSLINTQGEKIDLHQPSISWWLLFAVRQMLVLGLAIASEVIVIDFFCLRLRWINVFRSPLLTLLFVQSRGWPFRITTWAIYDAALLHGKNVFVRHWLFYQNYLKIFNTSNPCGNITFNETYTQLIIIFLCIGLATSFKRVYVGYMQGKRVFATYGEEVAKIMKKVLLITQVGILAKDIEIKAMTRETRNESARMREDDIWEKVEEFVHNDEDGGLGGGGGDDGASKGTVLEEAVLDSNARDELTGDFSQSQQMKIIELLGQWEDPEAETGMGDDADQNISVMSILQFRQSLAFFEASSFMFGHNYGPTDTREHCIESSEDVYARLLLRSNRDDTLSFHVLAMLALNADGTLKQEKIKDLIHIFRPQRDGTLTVLDFVKSVDKVYKKMKTLRASIKKAQRLDQAVEGIFNIGFFVVVGCITLAVVGINPLSLFLSLSSIVLAFAFMIGSASAKYFEGLLFILVRKPYGVGDKVYFNNPQSDCSPNGSAGWFVRDITLYHTTLVYGTTNECCTVSNGSLASLRVINAARSPKGTLYVYLKFGIEVPWSKIQVFETALRAFVKSRPREWLGLNGFRTTRVEADLGFHEMVVVLQHRESWQNTGALLVSKAEVTAFCHELQKKMDMRYKSPPLPVDLTVNRSGIDPFAIVNDKDIGQGVVSKFAGAPTEALASGKEEEPADADASASHFESVAKLFGKKD